jgi:hypothetical protein
MDESVLYTKTGALYAPVFVYCFEVSILESDNRIPD